MFNTNLEYFVREFKTQIEKKLFEPLLILCSVTICETQIPSYKITGIFRADCTSESCVLIIHMLWLNLKLFHTRIIFLTWYYLVRIFLHNEINQNLKLQKTSKKKSFLITEDWKALLKTRQCYFNILIPRLRQKKSNKILFFFCFSYFINLELEVIQTRKLLWQ